MEQWVIWAAVLTVAVVCWPGPVKLMQLALRTALAAVFLAIIAPYTGPFGVKLGLNLFNALVLGALGLPGLGLLLLLGWTCL